MKVLNALFLACLLALASCQNTQEGKHELDNAEIPTKESKSKEVHSHHSEEGLDPEKAKMKAEVMEIHDDAMAKMSKLYDLEVSLKAALDSASEEDLNATEQRISLLQRANKDMMDWMKQYKDPKAETSLEEAKKYFDSQLISITEVKVLTDSSIALAQEYLNLKAKE